MKQIYKVKKMNILFLGSNLPDVFEGKVKYLSAAGNQYQNNLVRTLRKKHDVRVLTYINYPILIEKKEIEEQCRKENYTVFFSAGATLKICKAFRKAVYKEIEWADIVIVYNVLYVWLGIGFKTKQKGKKSILIVADYTDRSEQKGIIRKLLAEAIKREFNRYTKTIILSPGIKKYLKKEQSFLLINGCIRWERFSTILPAEIKNNIINIVYTGGFSHVVGTDLMLEAFKKVKDQDVRLILCGQGGDMKERASKAQMEDSRIEYKGFLSRPEYYEILNKANILINPRNMQYEQNSANFPSKVLEYIATGRYVISTKFIGWEAYQDEIIFSESDKDSLAQCIIEVASEVKANPNRYYVHNREFAQKIDWDMMADKYIE